MAVKVDIVNNHAVIIHGNHEVCECHLDPQLRPQDSLRNTALELELRANRLIKQAAVLREAATAVAIQQVKAA